MPYEPHQVFPGLWIGSQPPVGDPLSLFSTLVLCAADFQPPEAALAFPGKIWRVRLWDWEVPLSDDERRSAFLAARAIAGRIHSGHRVLVTCVAGLNRSALIAGLAMLYWDQLLNGQVTAGQMTPFDVIYKIRMRRDPAALSNRAFVSMLQEGYRRFANLRRESGRGEGHREETATKG